jgi:methylthioribose-1-phosphate isomerase
VTLYQHPNIRDLTAEQLHTLIEAKRNQRLLTAIEVDNARKRKLTKIGTKDLERYNKLGDRCATRLAKISDLLAQCDQDLVNMQKLSSSVGLVEAELGEGFTNE